MAEFSTKLNIISQLNLHVFTNVQKMNIRPSTAQPSNSLAIQQFNHSTIKQFNHLTIQPFNHPKPLVNLKFSIFA
jgi:hypothetical protein